MKTTFKALMLPLLLTACFEGEVSKDKYNAGWAKAVSEGCSCNSNFSEFDNSKEAQSGFGWADGYVNSCLKLRSESC